MKVKYETKTLKGQDLRGFTTDLNKFITMPLEVDRSASLGVLKKPAPGKDKKIGKKEK